MSEHESAGHSRRSGGARAIKTLVIAVLLVAAALIWFVLHKPVPPPQPQPVLPVETVRPTVGNLDRSITLDSFVQSTSNVAVHPKVAGTLVSLDAEVGTKLHEGTVIAKIDPEPYQLTLNQAKAFYDGAKSVYDRQKSLYASGATSQQNFDEARSQFDNARSQYDLAKLHLSYTNVVSPIDGTVVQRNVSKGQVVSQSVAIVTITNTHDLIVRVPVPESYTGVFERERKTMPITATVPALGSREHTLHIRSIAPAIDVKTKTFTVECDFAGSTTGIMPGMFAEVTFVLERRANVPYLPYSVLVGGNTLWYVTSNGTAQSLTLTPRYHNDEYFELPQKYKDYTFIVVGQHFLSAGTPVKAISPGRVAQ